MLLKKIDILSPQITLYYKGSRTHSSIISGILTIITFLLIVSCSINYSFFLFNRQKEIPKVSTFNMFIEDSGEFPINSSSLFHFISALRDLNHPENEEFDFTRFNLVGIDTYVVDESDQDLSKYNHWLYGFCNNDTDTKGISHLITQKFFTKSACIRKYFNSSEQKYYDTNDANFKWPKMAHGTFSPNSQSYSILLTKCNQNILNIVFNNEYNCVSDLNIGNNTRDGVVRLNFIDQYVDILDYKDTIKKYFYRIENSLYIDSFSSNYLNFNPTHIKTKNGYLLEKSKLEKTYTYERNDVLISLNTQDIYMSYTLCMNNRLNYYERTYKTILDALSDIGGVSQSIITIAIFINNIFNKFTSLSDIKCLLDYYKIENNKISPIKININSKNRNINKKNDKQNSLGQISENRKVNICNISNVNDEKSEKNNCLNQFYNNNKQNILEVAHITTDNKGIENIKSNNNKDDGINFWEFIIYKLSFGKKHSTLKYYEDFRAKIISVENIVEHHLKINNLLKYKK